MPINLGFFFLEQTCIGEPRSDCKTKTEPFILPSRAGAELAVEANLTFCL